MNKTITVLMYVLNGEVIVRAFKSANRAIDVKRELQGRGAEIRLFMVAEVET